jgi:hypothetical protein
MELFRKKINEGFLYDLIILDCCSPKSLEFAISVRDIENNIKEHLNLCGLYSKKTLLNDWNAIKLDVELSRPLEENGLKNVLEEMGVIGK